MAVNSMIVLMCC